MYRLNPLSQGLIILALLVPLWRLLRRDYVKGLAYAVMLFVSMTPLLRLETLGMLPVLTFHRLALCVVFLAWLRIPDLRQRLRQVPLRRLVGIVVLTVTISMCGTDDLLYSVKRYLDIVLEQFLFYFIMATSVQTADDSRVVLRGAWLGLTIVSVLAVIERWFGFNPVRAYLSLSPGSTADVTATYAHRIHLGAAMAMGWLLCQALLRDSQTRHLRRVFLAMSLPLLLAACYFAMSRGPWLACVLGAGVVFVLGSSRVRGYVFATAVIATTVLVLRPGVYKSLFGLLGATLQSNTHKGGSFMWRLELWQIAWSWITESPWRFLFGFGPGAGHIVERDWVWSFRDKVTIVSSWDNQYAYYLMQLGVVGFLAVMSLYAYLWVAVFRTARSLEQPRRDIAAGMVAAIGVLLFMMSNVFIFSRQLDYLFWSLVACTFAMSRSALIRQNADDGHSSVSGAEYLESQ